MLHPRGSTTTSSASWVRKPAFSKSLESRSFHIYTSRHLAVQAVRPGLTSTHMRMALLCLRPLACACWVWVRGSGLRAAGAAAWPVLSVAGHHAELSLEKLSIYAMDVMHRCCRPGLRLHGICCRHVQTAFLHARQPTVNYLWVVDPEWFWPAQLVYLHAVFPNCDAGRSASHIALEVALQTHPQVRGQTLKPCNRASTEPVLFDTPIQCRLPHRIHIFTGEASLFQEASASQW